MKVLTIVSVGLLLLGIFSCSVQSVDPPPATETTVSNSTGTEPPTTSASNSTGTEPPTTSASNSTGTEPPTTSGSNSTGTEPSTTPSGSNPTGTEPPTTTPAPAPTTTTQSPLTTIKPEIQTGMWNVSGDDGKICILLDLAATFNITYNSTTSGVTSTKFALVTVPVNATESGSCNGSEYIFLQFKNTERGADFSFNTTFSKGSSTYDVASMTFSFTYDDETFINPDYPGQVATLTATVPDFMKSINSKNSITCADNREIKFSGLDGDATLHIDDIKVQAYMETTARTYGEGKNCVAKKTSKVVPIAVGCALAALVVVVLIAYLIGRRRSRQQGYQSV